MKVCPRCFTRFPDGERFCLHDSAVLVEEEDIARLGHNIGNYRLDKIESLTGLDPKRFDGAMMLRFALLLCQLDNEALCNCPVEPVVEAVISDNRPMMPLATPA